MGRPLKAKKLANLTVSREEGTYRISFEDEAGKKVLFEVTSDQALRLADVLDYLLAKEEQEQQPVGPPAKPPSDSGQERAGDPAHSGTREASAIVKWYNSTKGFGF